MHAERRQRCIVIIGTVCKLKPPIVSSGLRTLFRQAPIEPTRTHPETPPALARRPPAKTERAIRHGQTDRRPFIASSVINSSSANWRNRGGNSDESPSPVLISPRGEGVPARRWCSPEPVTSGLMKVARRGTGFRAAAASSANRQSRNSRASEHTRISGGVCDACSFVCSTRRETSRAFGARASIPSPK